MSNFKKLVVWQKAHALALHAHRTAMGIRASRYEYHLMLARDMEVIPDAQASSLLAELIQVRKMLHGLLKRIKLKKVNPKSSSTGYSRIRARSD